MASQTGRFDHRNNLVAPATVEPVVVNTEACRKLAALLSSWTIPIDREDSSLPWMSPDQVGNFYLLLVAISDLRAKLMEGREVTPEEDIAIRHAVHTAIMLVSEYSGIRNPSLLHYLFWNVFRSCCSRTSTHCKACTPECSLPARYVPLTLFPQNSRHCPFSVVCVGATQKSKLLEHVIDTDYY